MYKSKYSQAIDKKVVRCTLCNHYCVIPNGGLGKCRVRQNINGELISLNWGRVCSICIDPIEKKPLYHYYPGAKVLSFACLGCNFTCLNCQNSYISNEWTQEDLTASSSERIILPVEIVRHAVANKVLGIAYTYSEPTVYWDYISDIISESRIHASQLKHILVTNGYFSDEVLDEIISNNMIDAMNIDLKFIDEANYKKIAGAKLQPILHNIERIVNESDIQLEITNLLIPGVNDSEAEIDQLCNIIKSISAEIPIHFSAFFPTYKMRNSEQTPMSALIKAKQIAETIGIRNIYIGNTLLDGVSDTLCEQCGGIMIKRKVYDVTIMGKIVSNGIECAKCSSVIEIII